MRDKTSLTRAELELTQRIQLHFPENIDPAIIQKWNNCKKEVLAARLMELFLAKSPSHVLVLLNTVRIPVGYKSFDARDYFVIDKSSKAKVKISSVNEAFKKNFQGKVEEVMGDAVLYRHQMIRSLIGGAIVAELGGEKFVEVKLYGMFAAMEMQPNGESGLLDNRGNTNIFFIRDIKRRLWAIACSWNEGGWSIAAYSLNSTTPWESDHFVISA